MNPTPYPITVTARLDDVSRGLWIVKWILAIPHYLILLVLWASFAVLSVIAFVSILITGRYPRRIFDFNVGVMRWTWRVTYYAYGALGTDRYPPFTLAEVADYPAHLEVVYPERLSRGLVLVKWWLLALPHYVVVAFFVGGGLFAVDATSQDSRPALLGGGLIGLLVLIAAVILLVSSRYPRPIFDLVIGLQRWVIRVAGYAALMTDVYPPFRLDQGCGEDDSMHPATAPDPVAPRGGVAPLVLGGLVLGVATLLGLTAASVLVADRTLPGEDGFLMTPDVTYSSSGHAITSEAVDLGDSSMMGPVDHLLGDAKVTVSPIADEDPLFVGVAPTADVERYLDGVARSTVVAVEVVEGQGTATYRESTGGPPSTPPGDQRIWTDNAQGEGRQSISFPVQSGSWTVVVMNTDGTPGVSAAVQAGATFPAIAWIISGLLFAAGYFLLLGIALLIIGSTSRRGNRSAPNEVAPPSGQDDRTPASA